MYLLFILLLLYTDGVYDSCFYCDYS